MNLNGAMNAGKVTLTSSSGIEETGSAILTATNLVGTAGGAVSLTHANQITTLGAFTDTGGAFSLTNAQALKQVGTLNTGGQVASLTTTAGAIAIDGKVEASTLTLDAKAGQLTESGTLERDRRRHDQRHRRHRHHPHQLPQRHRRHRNQPHQLRAGPDHAIGCKGRAPALVSATSTPLRVPPPPLRGPSPPP